jgi:hypothetical protein
MTQGIDELLLTTVIRPRAKAWRLLGMPIAWPIAALFAAAFLVILMSLPGDVLAPASGGYPPDVVTRFVLALVGALGIAGLMLTIFYTPVPQFGSLTIAVPGSRPLTVRRADAHPDAPPRRPLFAQDEIGEPWKPEHVDGPEQLSQPAELVAVDAELASSVDALISRLESGLATKPSPAERSGPRPVGPTDADYPSPAARQQRELREALHQSLDQLGGRVGAARG